MVRVDSSSISSGSRESSYKPFKRSRREGVELRIPDLDVLTLVGFVPFHDVLIPRLVAGLADRQVSRAGNSLSVTGMPTVKRRGPASPSKIMVGWEALW
jgi:hypothetical protein